MPLYSGFSKSATVAGAGTFLVSHPIETKPA